MNLAVFDEIYDNALLNADFFSEVRGLTEFVNLNVFDEIRGSSEQQEETCECIILELMREKDEVHGNNLNAGIFSEVRGLTEFVNLNVFDEIRGNNLNAGIFSEVRGRFEARKEAVLKVLLPRTGKSNEEIRKNNAFTTTLREDE